MQTNESPTGVRRGTPAWREAVARYETPNTGRSLWQLANTAVPFLILWYFTYRSLEISYWLTFALSLLEAGLLIRLFIIAHDCGHGAFFKSQKANDVLGMVLGVFLFTPYYAWRKDHAIHHASAGDLDRRGVGDIWTLTVREYLCLPLWRRIAYRFYRNPIVMFGIGPPFVFLVQYRFLGRGGPRRVRLNLYWTDFAIGAVIVGMSALIGVQAYALVQLPMLLIAAMAGIWLFYVQHQFEGVYWERHDNWDYLTEALQGSSFYKLPAIFQWFTGNIGFHHIHHLSPRIPNYYLERCHNENALFQQVQPISFLASLKSLTYRLWDEDNRRLVGFRALKRIRNQQPAASNK